MSSYKFLNPKKLAASSSSVDTSGIEKKLAAMQTRINELEHKSVATSQVQPQVVGSTSSKATEVTPAQVVGDGCCCASTDEKVAFPDYQPQSEHETIDIVANNRPYSKQLYFTSSKDQIMQYTHNKTNDTLHMFYTAENSSPGDTDQYAVLKRGNNYSLISNGLFIDDDGNQYEDNYVGSAFSGRVWLAARESALYTYNSGSSWNQFNWTSNEAIPLTSPDQNGRLFAFGDVKYAKDHFLAVGALYKSYWGQPTPLTFDAAAAADVTRTNIMNAIGESTVNGIMRGPKIITANKDGSSGAAYPMVNTESGASNQLSSFSDLSGTLFDNLVDGDTYTINWVGIRLTDVSYLKVNCEHDLIVATGFFELVLADAAGDELRISVGVSYVNYGFAPSIETRWTSFLVEYDSARQGPTYPLHGAGNSAIYGGATPIIFGPTPILSQRAFVTVSSGYKDLMLSEMVYEEAGSDTTAATISEIDFSIDETEDVVTNMQLVYSEPISYIITNEGPQRVGMLSHQFGSQTTSNIPDPDDNELVVYHKPLMLWTGSEWIVSVRDSDNVYQSIVVNYEYFDATSTQLQSIEVDVHDLGIVTLWNGGTEFATANLQDANNFQDQLPGIGTDLQWAYRSDKAQVATLAYPYTDDPANPFVILDEHQVASGAYNNVLNQDLDTLLSLGDSNNANLMQVRHNIEGYYDYQCEPSTTLLVTSGPESGDGGLTYIEGDDVFESNTQLQNNYVCAQCGDYFFVGRKNSNDRKAILFTDGRLTDPANQWDGRSWSNNSQFYLPIDEGQSTSSSSSGYGQYKLYNGGNSGPPAIYDIMSYEYTDSDGFNRCFLIAVGKPIQTDCAYHFMWVSPGVEIEGGQLVAKWYSVYWKDKRTTGYTIERLTSTVTGSESDQVYNDRLLIGASESRIFLFSPVNPETSDPTPVTSPTDLFPRNRWCILARISDIVTQHDLASYAVVGIKHEQQIMAEPTQSDSDYRLGFFPRIAILLNDQQQNNPLWRADDAFAMFGDLNHTTGSGWHFDVDHVTDLTNPFYTLYRYGNEGFAVGGQGIRIWDSNTTNWEPASQSMLSGIVYDLGNLGDGTYAATGVDADDNGVNGLFYTSDIETQPFSLLQSSVYPVWSACTERPDCCIPTESVPAICNSSNTVVTIPQYLCLGQQVSWRVCYNESSQTPEDCPDIPDTECIVDTTTALATARRARSTKVSSVEPDKVLVGCKSCGY